MVTEADISRALLLALVKHGVSAYRDLPELAKIPLRIMQAELIAQEELLKGVDL
jgi:hypothetical protein